MGPDNGPGRYTLRVPIEDGRRVKRVVQVESRRKAEEKLEDLKRELRDGLHPEVVTVGRWLDRWMERRERAGLDPKTLDLDRWAVDQWLKPRLGNIPLRKLLPMDIEARLLDAMADGGLMPATIRKVRSTLAMALKYAVKNRKMDWNPARETDIPDTKNRGRPSRAMSDEELASFLAAAEGDPLEACWLIMATCGLRPGEVCGLRREDLELDATPLLHMRAARVEGGEGVRSGKPKGAERGKGESERTLALAPTVVAALKRHLARQSEARLRIAKLWVDNDLVFPREDGRFHSRHSFRGRFKTVIGRAGLERWHPHELRHSWATTSERLGIPVEEISAAAGHSPAGGTTTEKVYIHRAAVRGVRIAEVMEEMLKGRQASQATGS
jgi:integrase